MTSFFE